MPKIDFKALMHIEGCKDRLTRQEYSTLRGQALAGDGDGALKGLRRILSRGR